MKNCVPRAVVLVALGVVYCYSVRAHANPVSPNQTEPQEPHWQLFLDDHVITRSTGFQRVVHHPRPRGVTLEADKPWESTRGVGAGYVGWRKDGSLECYYMGLGELGPVTCYAISDDGIHWKKPNLGLVDTKWGKENNLVPIGIPRDMKLYGNVHDPDIRYAFPEHPYKRASKTFFCSEMPDVLNDPNWRDKLVESGGYFPRSGGMPQFWDDIHQEWVGIVQAPNHPPVRCIGRLASTDMNSWTLEHFLYPDAHDSTDPRYFHEAYNAATVHIEGITVAFIHWFIGDRTHPNPEFYEDGHDKPTTDEGLIGKSVAKGTMELRIATSRDGGMTWDRTVSREAWIPHGTEQHSYDRLVRGCRLLRNGDEDWIYCAGYDGDHELSYYHDRGPNQIRGLLYTQKHNRFVSLKAGNSNQILITKPLEVTGKTLQLNVDGSRGEVKVAIGIDKWLEHKNGNWPFKAKLPHWMVEDRWERTHLEEGFHFDDCEPVRENSIEHDVKWKEASLESLMGKTVRLYILVQDADLYGFRFK